MNLDQQETLIARALIKNPRMSDNKVGKLTAVPIRTVSRKRKAMEESGVLNYYTSLSAPTKARHMYITKFKMGFTKGRIFDEIKREPKVKSLFSELIQESHFAEVDGHMAIILFVEGITDSEITENFNGKILPAMLNNHGQDSIIEVNTIRLNSAIRLFHNYLPGINIKNGKLHPDWPLDSIFTE